MAPKPVGCRRPFAPLEIIDDRPGRAAGGLQIVKDEGATDYAADLVGVEWLGDEVEGPVGKRVKRVVESRIAGDDDDLARGVDVMDRGYQVEPAS